MQRALVAAREDLVPAARPPVVEPGRRRGPGGAPFAGCARAGRGRAARSISSKTWPPPGTIPRRSASFSRTKVSAPAGSRLTVTRAVTRGSPRSPAVGSVRPRAGSAPSSVIRTWMTWRGTIGVKPCRPSLRRIGDRDDPPCPRCQRGSDLGDEHVGRRQAGLDRQAVAAEEHDVGRQLAHRRDRLRSDEGLVVGQVQTRRGTSGGAPPSRRSRRSRAASGSRPSARRPAGAPAGHGRRPGRRSSRSRRRPRRRGGAAHRPRRDPGLLARGARAASWHTDREPGHRAGRPPRRGRGASGRRPRGSSGRAGSMRRSRRTGRSARPPRPPAVHDQESAISSRRERALSVSPVRAVGRRERHLFTPIVSPGTRFRWKMR